MSEVSLFDSQGNRKYVTPEERQRFYDATGEVSKEWRMFGLMFYYTGCRISEALSLKVKDIDFSSSAVTLNSLKQRRDDVYRQVPLPDSFLRSLDDVFDKIEGIQATPKGLRHGYAIACLDKGIALNMVQKWMGHKHIQTTAIYANATGKEERKIAAKLWES